MDRTPEVILIGLDGLGFEEISEWIEDGTLSTLSTMVEAGTACDLQSTHPPWTPCAWPSLLSGRNPGKHGVFDFFTREGYDKRLIDRSDVDSPYLFEVADSLGLTSVVINYPVTYPISNLEHGAVIPGYLAREDVSFHPEYLREEYESIHGKYIIYPEYGASENQVQDYVKVAQCRRDAARFLNERFDWDLLAVQFQVTDSVFHDFDDREMIRDVLVAVDDFVGDIIQLGTDETTVMITSDHGMGDYEWTFYVNSWLADRGYCEITQGDTQYFRQKKSQLKGINDKPNEPGRSEQMVGAAIRQLSRVGMSPQRLHQTLSTVGLMEYVQKLLPERALEAAQNQVVDHARSTAYQLYFNSLGIHMNVEGSNPSGVVSQRDYEDVRTTLMQELREIRDPDGNYVFEEVQRREQIYEGDHVSDAPDIMFTPRNYQYDVSGSILDMFRRHSHKNHKPDGILITNQPLQLSHTPEIYDIAPTVAAILDIPIDVETDGTVLTSVSKPMEREDWDDLASVYLQRRSVESTSSVEDRLADLGYME